MERTSTKDESGPKSANSKKNDAENPAAKETNEQMQRIFGCTWADFQSWQAFIKLLHRPSDPANVAILRIVYGLLMTVDCVMERGLAYADSIWGDHDECRFPLFNFLAPMDLEWMYIAYLVMALGAFGILLGFLYRLSCVMFIIPYWYLFMLDKTAWNNHSYLFGLIGTMLCFIDGNRYWSIDGLIWPKIRNSHVPLWNYTLLRSQIFFVYFIAGLKKMDMDWITGESMEHLSNHWVFSPFMYFMTTKQVDVLVVHLGGLALDLSLGYLLFFDATRPIAFAMGGSFHLMNSQIFSIGMFPYAMLATMPLFSAQDWPRKLFRYIPNKLQFLCPNDSALKKNPHCLYGKDDVKPEDGKSEENNVNEGTPNESAPKKLPSTVIVHSKPQTYHNLATIYVVAYLATQIFMPYSHFVTQGYNNWTNGLYGYSWDMMIHSWRNQHIRITYIDKDTGKVGYLNPEAFCDTNRWASHGDMAKQHATCIANKLNKYDITNAGVYFDVWKSLNNRFQQRVFDPRVDIASAEWHPLKPVSWVLPLLSELSGWRQKLKEIEDNLENSTETNVDVVFVADFPGLMLENYIQEELANTTVTVLEGKVMVEIVDVKNVTLNVNESVQVPSGSFHNVHTVSTTPSCYMYTYSNSSDRLLESNVDSLFQIMKAQNISDDNFMDGQMPDFTMDADNDTYNDLQDSFGSNESRTYYQEVVRHRVANLIEANATRWDKAKKFLSAKYDAFSRSVLMTITAVESIVKGRPLVDVLKERDQIKDSEDPAQGDNIRVDDTGTMESMDPGALD